MMQKIIDITSDIFGMEPNMAFREKSAWIAVISTLVIWSYYFWTVAQAVATGQLDGDAVFWLFVWCMVATIAVMLPLNIVAALVARQKMDAPPDERERQIDAYANRLGLGFIEIMAMVVAGLSAWFSGYARQSFPDDPAGATAIIMANAILLVMVSSAVLREVVQIVHFRLMD